jgi:hypothetical protein
LTPAHPFHRRHAGWVAAGILFLVLAVLIAVRMHLVDQKVGVYIACQDCFDLDVILADLVTFSAVASLLLLAACTRSRIVARVPHLLCGLIFLVYIADLVVFSLYNSRLLMTDVALFYTEGAAVWNQFSTGLGGTVRALSILAGILALFGFLWWMPGTPTRSFRLTMAAILALSLGASAVFKGAPYVNDWAVENVFSANMSTPSRNRYQPETEEAILDREFPSHTRKAEGGPPAELPGYPGEGMAGMPISLPNAFGPVTREVGLGITVDGSISGVVRDSSGNPARVRVALARAQFRYAPQIGAAATPPVIFTP